MASSSDKDLDQKYLQDSRLTSQSPRSSTSRGTEHLQSNNPFRNPSSASSTRPPSYRSSLGADNPQSSPVHRSSSARLPNRGVPSSHRQSPSGGSGGPSGLSPLNRNRSSSLRSSEFQPPGHSRNRSLDERFPGDMSHRPLDVIRKESKRANKAPHQRHRSRHSNTDSIDALDTIGGVHHHDGPYEATLASRNLVEKYSPVAAVKDSNMEAIRATPKEYIKDSLEHHVPLQGTAMVPSGGYDFSGNFIEYEEGADLMREKDAAGGAYKQWDGITYHPDDLKGKGEPSYTIERDNKKHKDNLLGPGDYELRNMGPRRNRASSNAEMSGLMAAGAQDDAGLRRSNTTGRQKLTEGLKKRFHVGRKKSEEVH